jgi:hypothetical protein
MMLNMKRDLLLRSINQLIFVMEVCLFRYGLNSQILFRLASASKG